MMYQSQRCICSQRCWSWLKANAVGRCNGSVCASHSFKLLIWKVRFIPIQQIISWEFENTTFFSFSSCDGRYLKLAKIWDSGNVAAVRCILDPVSLETAPHQPRDTSLSHVLHISQIRGPDKVLRGLPISSHAM